MMEAPKTPEATEGVEGPAFPLEVAEDPRFRRLVAILRSLGRVAVAYSGGADSALLLCVARAVLGEGAVGVLATSESLDRNELEEAKRAAAAMGSPLVVIETHEYDNPDYRRNDGSRCYHCKDELFGAVKSYAAGAGIPHVADGSNLDDTGDYRPGLRARDEHGVRSPLLEAGIDKAAVRQFSRALCLPTWDKPAQPCLSSRIPYGSAVTAEKLRQVEAAEAGLRALGFRTVRVRHHDQVARLEVPLEDFPRLFAPEVLPRALAAVKGAGFLFVALDLEGFRSGSLNAALVPVTLSPTRRGEALANAPPADMIPPAH